MLRTDDLPARVSRRLVKTARSAAAQALTIRYRILASRGSRPVIDPSVPVVVSLTSFGRRLHRVHVTLESIARGSVRPGGLVLWLDPDEDPATLPRPIRRLIDRGLEIRVSPWAIGPHNKYFPAVSAPEPPGIPLVTADDDVLYPRHWLAQLLEEARRTPEMVVAHRVRDLLLDHAGRIAPYNSWPLTRATTPARRRFPTGSSGVLYPVALQLRLRDLGKGFESCCPRADDLWLHHAALLSGTLARQIRARARTFLEVPGTQTAALSRENTGQNGNDPQIEATYSRAAVEFLRDETAAHHRADT